MQYDVVFAAPLSGATTSVNLCDVLCRDVDGVSYAIASDAAMAAVGGLPIGVATTIGNSQVPVAIQVSGVVGSALTGLSTASVAGLGATDTAFAVRSSTGRLVRKVTPAKGDHVMGVVLPDGSVRLEPAYVWSDTVSVASFTDRTITVATPSVAPSNGASAGFASSALTAGHRFQVAYSYLGHNGITESALSAPTQFVGDGGSSLWVSVPSSMHGSCLAAAIRWYIRDLDDGVAAWHIADVPSSGYLACQPCDSGAFNCTNVVLSGSLAGGGHPGTDNATTFNGTAVGHPDPVNDKPNVQLLINMPPATYYVAVAYRAQNGVLTASSPTLSIAQPNNFGYLFFGLPEPPLGACSTVILAGTSSASLYVQDEIPVGASSYWLRTYSTSTPFSHAGTPTSTVSAIQWAWEAVRALGSGTVEIPAGTYTITCPLRLVAPPVGQQFGVRMRAVGHHGYGNSALSSAAIVYDGPTVGNTAICAYCSTSCATYQDIAFTDVGTLKNKIAFMWSAFGAGDAFKNVFERCTFIASGATGSIGMACVPQSMNYSAQAAALNVFRMCAFQGDECGLEWHGSQAVANTWDTCTIAAYNLANSARAADIKLFGGQFWMRSIQSLGQGHAVLAILSDNLSHPNAAISTRLTIDGFYCELYAAVKGVLSSGHAGDVHNAVIISNLYTLPNSGYSAEVYSALFCVGKASSSYSGDYVSFLGSLPNGRVHAFSPKARIFAPGLDEAIPISQNSSPDYARTAARLVGGLSFYNESQKIQSDGFSPVLTTNARGDLVLNPGSSGGFYIKNGAAVAAPTGGGVVYVEAGALKYRGSSGTVTVIAPA